MRTVRVDEKSELLRYLVAHLPEYSRKELKQFLKFGSLSVNGEATTKFDHPLKPGDRIDLDTEKKKLQRRPVKPQFDIVHEDEAILVVKKPAGLLTIATEKERTKTAYYMMTDYVQSTSSSEDARIFIVHRLDQDVSGLLVFAKTEDAKFTLQNGWEKAEKKYYAVVEGVPVEPTGVIQSYLLEDKFCRVYSGRRSPESKYAVTKYRVLKTTSSFSLLEVTLVTGRKNQIRVHLSDLGHPIIGDKKYGARTDPAHRLGLHAYYLAFEHPMTGEKMIFEDPLPEALAEVLGIYGTDI